MHLFLQTFFSDESIDLYTHFCIDSVSILLTRAIGNHFLLLPDSFRNKELDQQTMKNGLA